MCGSMVDIQSATTEIRREKKKRKKKKPQGKNIMFASASPELEGARRTQSSAMPEINSYTFGTQLRNSLNSLNSPYVVCLRVRNCVT